MSQVRESTRFNFLQDQDDLEWKPHFFVLTQRRLVYSEVPNQDDADNEDDVDTLLDHSISRAVFNGEKINLKS